MSEFGGPLRILDIEGSPEQMGATHGRAYAEEIRRYATERVDLVAKGSWSGGPIDHADVIEIASSMIAPHEAFDAGLHAEMVALADAAGISIEEAIIVGGFTDFVDTVRAVAGGAHPPTVVEDDCTGALVPDVRAGGAGFLAQTWDMHDSATEYVVLLRARPANGPAFRIFTTTGCLGQIGMNSEGVCVGVNNITGLDGARGVTWTSVVRAMLLETTADAALRVLLDAELAGAHNYMILDRAGVGFNVEAMPTVRPYEQLRTDPILHSNHAITAEAQTVAAVKDPPLMDSSVRRYEAAVNHLGSIVDRPVDRDDLFAMLREPSAICQFPTAPYHIESSGAVVMRPSTSEFWACWGPPINAEFELVPA